MFKKILLVLSALFFFLAPQTFAHTEVQVIEMTPSGFEPVEVTVDINQSVIFLNKDTNPRWPASNTHPTHELYPQLDPKTSIMPGDSWAFKSKKAGSWKFHDHNYPHFRGVLNVVSEDGQTSISEENNREDKRISSGKLEFKGPSIIVGFNNFLESLFVKIFGKKEFETVNLPDVSAFKKLTYEKQDETLRKIAKDTGSEKTWEFIKNDFRS